MNFELGIMNTRKNKGFSVIETLVAVSIIIFVVFSALTLASMSLKTISATKNYLIAENLAQEGVELIRALRGDNVIACTPFCSGSDWLNGMGYPNSICFSAGGCKIDATDLDPKQCPSGNPDQCILRFNGVYNHINGASGGQDTIFRRIIKLQEIQPDIEVKVNVEVFWTERSAPHRVIVEEDMFNWQ